jgi:hypothetical protein
VETSDEVWVEAKRGGGCSEEREERSERIWRVKRAESSAGRVESRVRAESSPAVSGGWATMTRSEQSRRRLAVG